MAASDKFKSFVFRESWWLNIKNLPNTNRADVCDAVCMYVFEGKEPEIDPMSATSMAVRFILTDIERDKAKYADVSAKRAAAGRRGADATNRQKAAKSANAENTEQNAGIADDKNGKSRQKAAKSANAENTEQNAGIADDKNGKSRQKAAKSAKGSNNDNDNEDDNVHDNDLQLGVKSNNSFLFSAADAEKKEKIIFDFSLILLSEGRPNAYKEATEAYNYNDATDWESEKTDPKGNVTKKKIRNRLAWIQSGWQRHNEQIFAPADGVLLANIIRRTGLRPENADIINAFRGFRFDGDDTNIGFLYTNRRAYQKFQKAINDNQNVNIATFEELIKVYPKVKQLHFVIY